MSFELEVFPRGPLDENTYLFTDNATGYKAIIDPGYFGEDIVQKIGNKSDLKLVLLTHGHYDHFFAAKKYLDQYEDAEFVAPLKDKYLMGKDWNNDILAFGNKTPDCPPADKYVSEGDEVCLGETVFGFIETPGHTEGSLCITCEDSIFSGDTLFRLSVGNTSFETGNWDELVNSINEKLYVLDENTKVYPGHGAPTTIGYEKRANPFV